MPREIRETLDPQGMLAGTTCLVTGGAGFVGSHIVELLLDAGAAEVRVIDNMVRGRRDNLARALASNRVRLIEGDIRDTATMTSLVAGCDTVFHQAALRITQCAQEPRAAFEVMVAATYRPRGAVPRREHPQAGRRLHRLGLWHGGPVPHHRGTAPLQQPHPLRRGQGLQRGAATAPSTTCTG